MESQIQHQQMSHCLGWRLLCWHRSTVLDYRAMVRQNSLLTASLLKRFTVVKWPGLMAASVWMTSLIIRPVIDAISRPKPLTIPAVSVWSNPKGFPIARTRCPTCRLLDKPTWETLREMKSTSASDLNGWKIFVSTVNLQHCKIFIWLCSSNCCFKFGIVRQGHLNLVVCSRNDLQLRIWMGT